MIDSQIEAIATASKTNCYYRCGETREAAQPWALAEISPSPIWIQLRGRWWFLGDDSELKTTSCDAWPSNFLRSFVPKRLRAFDELQLDTERLLWIFCAEDATIDDQFLSCQIPYHICGLPVVVMLPRFPCQTLDHPVLDEVRIDPTGTLRVEDLNSLWDAFPFATGICIWMSGHLQLLAPHLTNAEVAALVIPSRAAGLQVSISRWSPAPTAAESGSSSQQAQSNASFTKAESSRKFLNERGADSAQHLQTLRLSDAEPTNGMKINSPLHDPEVVMESSGPATPRTSFLSSHQTTLASSSPALGQATPGPVLPQSTYPPPGDSSVPPVSQVVQLSKLSGSKKNNAVLAHDTGMVLRNSRLIIGNTVSTAGVKVKVNSGPFAGRAFLSASTHAVFQGKTGKRLQIRSASNKKKKTMNPFAKIFSSTPAPEAIALAEVEVRDLHGNIVSRSHDPTSFHAET